jgi:hypothetical protein
MGGYLRVTGTPSANDSSSPKSSTATCTGGRRVVGGGYQLAADNSAELPELTVSQNRSLTDTTRTVTAAEGDAVSGNWSITAYAICGNATP